MTPVERKEGGGKTRRNANIPPPGENPNESRLKLITRVIF